MTIWFDSKLTQLLEAVNKCEDNALLRACSDPLQIFYNYGRKNNSALLCHYGFVIDHNPVKVADPFRLTVCPNICDSDCEKKLLLISEKDLPLNIAVGESTESEQFRRLLQSLRICLATSLNCTSTKEQLLKVRSAVVFSDTRSLRLEQICRCLFGTSLRCFEQP